MSIVAILELTFRPDVVADATETLKRALEQTRTFPGCESIEVLSDIHDPSRVAMIERWESVEADEAYRAWRKTPEGGSGIGAFVAAPPVLHFHGPHPTL